MREVRIFELEHGEPVAAWRVARPSTFKVISGEIVVPNFIELDPVAKQMGTPPIDRPATN